MLTNDDVKRIVELYGRGYSYRKIQEKTGFSERTVGKYVDELVSKVIPLKEEGLEVDQIASRLECSLACVHRVLKKYEENQNQEKNELETKVESEAGEEIKSLEKLDLRTELAKIQKAQELEQLRERIKKDVAESLANLMEMEDYYKEKELLDTAYDERQQMIKKKLNFVLTKADELDSLELLSELKHIKEEISESISILFDEYDAKDIEDRKRLERINKMYVVSNSGTVRAS